MANPIHRQAQLGRRVLISAGWYETRFRRVGAIFENARRETGEIFLSVKLDFPVAVTELVAFPPRPEDDPTSDEVTQS